MKTVKQYLGRLNIDSRPVPYYQYRRGYILPVRQNIKKDDIPLYIQEFFHSIGKVNIAESWYLERMPESAYIVMDIGDILPAYLLEHYNDLLPLSFALKVIEDKIRTDKKSQYLHGKEYSPIPNKFDSIIAYKNWLQGGFANFGWEFWTGIQDPYEVQYSASRAMYNACLNANHGVKTKRIPWAKIFFKELKKVEQRNGLKV